MLRMLVVALVALNLLLAGIWLALREPEAGPEAAPPRPEPADLPAISLMREADPPEPPASEERRCYSVGPFETQSSMGRVREQLAPHVLEMRERVTEALMELGYWVEMRALEEYGGAAEAVRALRQSGIDDVGVVTDEQGLLRISLGYFLEESNARSRRDRVRELGFAAETRVQRKAQPRYWLDYEQAAGNPPASELLTDATASGLHRSLPCDAGPRDRESERDPG